MFVIYRISASLKPTSCVCFFCFCSTPLPQEKKHKKENVNLIYKSLMSISQKHMFSSPWERFTKTDFLRYVWCSVSSPVPICGQKLMEFISYYVDIYIELSLVQCCLLQDITKTLSAFLDVVLVYIFNFLVSLMG